MDAQHLDLLYLSVAAAVATYVTRFGGYVLITQLKNIPPRIESALNAVPAAVLTTLVAPAFVYGAWMSPQRCSSPSSSGCASPPFGCSSSAGSRS